MIHWRGLDLSELIKELEKRGEIIEPPISEAKTIKGKTVKEKVRQITEKYFLDTYFAAL